MNIKLKISSYLDKNKLSNVYFDLMGINYRKKIKSDLYVNSLNFTLKGVEQGDSNYISKNILLEMLK